MPSKNKYNQKLVIFQFQEEQSGLAVLLLPVRVKVKGEGETEHITGSQFESFKNY